MKAINSDIDQRGQHIDLSLLRENLKLTPRQRLQQLERLANDIHILRNAVQAQQKPTTLS